MALAAGAFNTVNLLLGLESVLGGTGQTGWTVERMRIHFLWRPDADVATQLELGIVVDPGLMPAGTPASQPFRDWMYPYLGWHFVGAPGTTDLTKEAFVDIRARRKMSIDESLNMYQRATTASHIAWHVRTLVLLP